MKKSNNSQVNLLAFFFISLIALTVSGLLFKVVFFVYNYSQFSMLPSSEVVHALFWGLRFDLAAAALLSLVSCFTLWFFYRFLPAKKPVFFLLGFMLFVQMSLQIGDTVYFVEAGRHVSYEMRDALTDASGLFMTALTKHGFFIVLSYVLVLTVIFTSLKFAKNTRLLFTGVSLFPEFKLKYEAGLFVVLLLAVIIVRGGVTGLPQSVISAFKIGNAQKAIISMNGAYSVVYGAINSRKEISQVAVKLPADVDIKNIMSSLYPVPPNFSAPATELKKYNLIFILMEGWPADMMSTYGYEKQTTPFYDSLKERSLSPSGVMAGGVRTTEGVYAIFCSQQNPLGKTLAQTSLQNNPHYCLPEILKRQGWVTAFFQGSHKETSGTGAFAQSLGFTESYAKEDMPQGRYQHNYWGAHDPDIYDFVLDKLDTLPQPFLIGVNTNSTHDIQVPAGVKPFFGDASSEQKHQSILYFADQAMREFFEKIKTKPYYKNTVFIFMSDHTGGKHKTTAARYFIPGIIYAEELVPAGNINRYVSQRDFAPTVLDILGLPASVSFAGKSFWKTADDIYYTDYFDAGTLGWINGYSLVETSVTDPFMLRCYSIEKGLLDAETVECDATHKQQSLQSLVFTRYSQDLLFNGETEMFYRFLEKEK
ncbi:MAG: alkaline phosphatase family protein [Gammaproteobacteria bacterium]|nr:MAG: alkaline phosphatase family protein [Gammaproteobacteria bacterium]